MGQLCESRYCLIFFFLTATGIDRMSLLKCKFIIGISCAVIILTFYLIVSEQRRNIHLVNAFMKSCSTQCIRYFEDILQPCFWLHRSCDIQLSMDTLWQLRRDKRLNLFCHFLSMDRGCLVIDQEKGKVTVTHGKNQA